MFGYFCLGGYFIALYLATHAGAFKWFDSFGLWAGYAEQKWHTALLMEAVADYDRIKSGSSLARTILTAWLDDTTVNGIYTANCVGSTTPGNFVRYAVYGAVESSPITGSFYPDGDQRCLTEDDQRPEAVRQQEQASWNGRL